MTSASTAYLRKSIKEWLLLLKRELGHYEQTTHGSLRTNCSLKDVLDMLNKCYNEPIAFNISELDQMITNWAKQQN